MALPDWIQDIKDRTGDPHREPDDDEDAALWHEHAFDLVTKIEQLQAIVARLHRTADGVPIVLCRDHAWIDADAAMETALDDGPLGVGATRCLAVGHWYAGQQEEHWLLQPDGHMECSYWDGKVYSTREAAERSLANEQD